MKCETCNDTGVVELFSNAPNTGSEEFEPCPAYCKASALWGARLPSIITFGGRGFGSLTAVDNEAQVTEAGTPMIKGRFIREDASVEERVKAAIDLLRGTPYHVRTRIDEGGEE